MSIPKWRYVDYTDDGCSIYQCLNCYVKWEARTSPKYGEWKFCPHCGCKWNGEREWDANAKWERKKGINPLPNARLNMPLFVVEKKAVPLDENEIIEKRWETVSYRSEDLHRALQTLNYELARELDSEPFWVYYIYRITYKPEKNSGLVWSMHNNSDSKVSLLDLWKENKKMIDEIITRNKCPLGVTG